MGRKRKPSYEQVPKTSEKTEVKEPVIQKSDKQKAFDLLVSKGYKPDENSSTLYIPHVTAKEADDIHNLLLENFRDKNTNKIKFSWGYSIKK